METATAPPPTLADFPSAGKRINLIRYLGHAFVGLGAFGVALDFYQRGSFTWWMGPSQIAIGGLLYANAEIMKSQFSKMLAKLTAPTVEKKYSLWWGHKFAARVESPLSRDALCARIEYYLRQSQMPVTYNSPQHISSSYTASLWSEDIGIKLKESPTGNGTVVDLLWFGGAGACKHMPNGLVDRITA
ncbi:MAG: hypothetical protein HY438_00035 [DPANN group archaeon]|nr:hypothetical protein [DPANN group archaeon]